MKLLHLNPTTCKMLAAYHADAGHPETEIMWLRAGVTLAAIEGYNEGTYTETDMHAFLQLAQSDNEANIRERAYEHLP